MRKALRSLPIAVGTTGAAVGLQREDGGCPGPDRTVTEDPVQDPGPVVAAAGQTVACTRAGGLCGTCLERVLV